MHNTQNSKINLNRFWHVRIIIIAKVLCTCYSSVVFYPFGTGYNDSSLEKNDDAYTTINIAVNFPFFGKEFSKVHISTNGIIYLGQGSTSYTPVPYPINGTLSVAAYWVDSDPRQGGDIYYREELNPGILNQITNYIRNKFVQFNTFTSTWSLIVTFNNVPHFDCRASIVYPCQKVVNHQTILTSSGIHSFVIFLYDRLDYSNAQIGFNAGDGKRFFLLPNSNTVIISKYALENSNVGSPGEWAFYITDQILEACNSRGLLTVFPKKVLFFGSQELYINGPCIDSGISKIEVQIGPEIVLCDVLGYNIKCLTPYLESLESHPVSLNYGNVNYKGFVVAFDVTDPSVQKYYNYVLDGSAAYFEIKWDPTRVSSSTVVLRGVKVIVSLDENMTITNVEKKYISITVYNTGLYKFYLPESVVSQKSSFITRFLINVMEWITEIYQFFTSEDCDSWYSEQRSDEEMKKIADSKTCPINLNEASVTAKFNVDKACNRKNEDACLYYHPGALECYRGPYESGAAAQCCYGPDENLLTDPPGAGTLDVGEDWNHFVEDVIPYIMCCKQENKCDKYYKKRPVVRSNNTEPPKVISIGGDPHFYTADGRHYDFNPVGEFIFMQAHDIIFQTRMSQLQSKRISYFSAFAIKVSNYSTVQVDLVGNENLQLKFGNEIIDEKILNLGFANIESISNSRYKIDFSTGFSVILLNYNGLGHLIITLQPYLKTQIKGLIGYWDNIINNDFMLPNGTWIPLNSSNRDIHYNFGMSWSTTSQTSIFTYPEGLGWNDFQNKNFDPFLDEFPDDPRCEGDRRCSFDVFVTGDINIGLANVAVAKETEQLNKLYQKANKTCSSEIIIPDATVTLQGNSDYSNVNYSIKCNANFMIIGKSFVRCIGGTLMDKLGSCIKSGENSLTDHYFYFWFLAIFTYAILI